MKHLCSEAKIGTSEAVESRRGGSALCAQFRIAPVVMLRSHLRFRYGQVPHAVAVSVSLCLCTGCQGNALSAAQRNISAVKRQRNICAVKRQLARLQLLRAFEVAVSKSVMKM